MNVLSLFDGIACGYEALIRSGHNVDNYYASEIHKPSIKIAIKNHPDIQCIGNVIDVCPNFLFDNLDLIIGGSPCQGFSSLGNRLSFDDERSGLFFEFVRILDEAKSTNPDIKFLLENVKMKNDYQDIISNLLGVKPILINAKLVSAQSRQRLFWTNINVGGGIPQPLDRNIFLSDILQRNVDERYYITGKQLLYANSTKQSHNNHVIIDQCNANKYKSMCLLARGYGTWNGTYIRNELGVRKLTEIEFERLQGLPDNYTEGISSANRYNVIGNGWNIETIEHILNHY